MHSFPIAKNCLDRPGQKGEGLFLIRRLLSLLLVASEIVLYGFWQVIYLNKQTEGWYEKAIQNTNSN